MEQLIKGTPSYVDLGKEARDVFGKGYHIGLWRIMLTSRLSDVELKTYGETYTAGKMLGVIEGKYKIVDHGINLLARYNTDNDLFGKISCENKIADGLKTAVEAGYGITNKEFLAKLVLGFGRDTFQLDSDITIQKQPLINFAAVLGHKQFALGWQTGYNIGEKAVTANNLGFQFSENKIILHAFVNNFLDSGRIFGLSCFSRCSDELNCCVGVGYSDSLTFSLGTVYKLKNDAIFRAKVNQKVQVGIGYQQKIRDGITLFCSTLLEATDPKAGGHRIGVCLELEA